MKLLKSKERARTMLPTMLELKLAYGNLEKTQLVINMQNT